MSWKMTSSCSIIAPWWDAELPRADPLINVAWRDLTVALADGTVALLDASGAARAGRLCAIVGPSGVGGGVVLMPREASGGRSILLADDDARREAGLSRRPPRRASRKRPIRR